MKIDWNELENCLFNITVDAINQFASSHQDETFYGFAFDCNSEYGNVLLCFNTPESLRQRSIEYADNSTQPSWFDQVNRDIEEKLGKKIFDEPEQTTPEEEAKELRWSLGDWKYQDFSWDSEILESGWDSFEQAVLDQCSEEQENDEEDEETFMTPVQEKFMLSMCRVLIRLEGSKVFNTLKLTADFKVYVADHDEWEKESWSRLESVRNQ